MARVLIPIPARDFDPTEVAVSWKTLSDSGHEVAFATPDGLPSEGDPLMLTGEGLDVWGCVPGLKKLKLLGVVLRANSAARAAYRLMIADPRFKQPLRYGQLSVDAFDALLLPGGHWSRGMRTYLESAILQAFVATVFEAQKPVAAVCHGVVLAARSKSPSTGKSVLFGRKTTALTWALENSAWSAMKYVGRFWDPNYYRTYVESGSEPKGYWGVQSEVERALATPADFMDVAPTAPHYFRKTSGLYRDSPSDSSPAFVVEDGPYLSARWPGDVHTFAARFCRMI